MSRLVREIQEYLNREADKEISLFDNSLFIEKQRGYQAFSISDVEPDLYTRSGRMDTYPMVYEYNKRNASGGGVRAQG